jgi:GxxExxY protein
MDEVLNAQTYRLIGEGMYVHRQLGHGFSEAVYHDALLRRLRTVGIPVRSQVEVVVPFDGAILGPTFRLDLVCFEAIPLELKALPQIGNAEQRQVLNYLKASGFELALLLNFGTPSLQVRRFIMSRRAAATTP